MQIQHGPLSTELYSCRPSSVASQELNINISGHRPWLSDPLALKTHEIVSRIKEVVCLKPRNSIITISWSSVLEEISLQFFSPPNIRKFLGLYWACWHPNWPVIHKPTFSPLTAQSDSIGIHGFDRYYFRWRAVLSLAMLRSTGACISPERSDNEQAKTWFDSVEEMTFGDQTLYDNSETSSMSQPPFEPSEFRPKVQALQAAYAVCLYQNWEGSDRNKRRIRRHKYSTVVAVSHQLKSRYLSKQTLQVARDLGLGNAKHDNSRFGDLLYL